MPFFRKRVATVEAYRMPQEGQEPSDGLIFFLEANGLSIDQIGAAPGDWVVADGWGKVSSCTPVVFHVTYEQV